MRHLILNTTLASIVASFALAAAPPAKSIESTIYNSSPEAQQGWRPMKGSQPVSAKRIDNRATMEFPCNFASAEIERASWDHALQIDLSDARGVQFQVLCPDMSPVSYFSLYFQTPGGWYHSSWFPERDNAWHTVNIDKSQMSPEGAPAGWSQVTAVRISAWKGLNKDTQFFIRGLQATGRLGGDTLVAVLRGDSAAARSPAQAKSIFQAADRTVNRLRQAGIECATLSDSNLVTAQLTKARLVVLPNNANTEAGSLEALARFVRSGGKVLAFGFLPAGLSASTNCVLVSQLPTTDDAAGKLSLLAIAGSLVPDLWRFSIESQLEEMIKLGDCLDLGSLTNRIIRTAKKGSPALSALNEALEKRGLAIRLLAQSQPEEAMKAAQSAAGLFEKAFCAAHAPKLPEFRAFWCHSAEGVKGMSWNEAITRLSDNGFNAVIPNMLWGGAAFYPSKVLPAARDYNGQDQVKACLDACRKHGVQMHVWKVNHYLGGHARPDFAAEMKAAERLQVSFQNEPHDWLCPSHPDNQKLEINSMIEIVRNYPVDGIHFDYIRYPGADHCFCRGCKKRFEEASGIKVADWPGDIRAKADLKEKWNEWRRGNITSIVRNVSEQARAIRANIKISAAVFRLWDNDRDSVAQDWKVWCDKGYLDFVCPMDYTPSDRAFENMLTRQLEWAGKVPCYPGLGLSASRSKFGADRAIEQILITRKHNTGGFVIFNYGVKEANDVLPLLGLGITRPEK